jgi:hypothetical protein
VPSITEMSGGQRADTAEDLLGAEGEWTLIEEKRSPSPVQKHMESRGQVKPTQISKSGNYTEKAKDMHVNEDIHFRVLRLERQMDTIRDNLDGAAPDLQYSTAKTAAKPKLKIDPAPMKVANKAVSGGALRVTSVRTGMHPGKVRFVLDMSQKPTFSYDLDNDEKLLLVELPNTGWDAAMRKSLGSNPLIKSYSVRTSGDGASRLAIELRAPVQVGMAKVFAPNRTYGHRIVLDVSKL